MEILNILYNNNNIAFYLIGAILVVIIIFIVISSMYTTPKEEKKEEILKDPTEEEKNITNILEINNEIKEEEIKKVIKDETKDIPKINDIVESIYQKSINIEEKKEETQDLNSFLQEFEVPNNIIEEVVSSDKEETSLETEVETEIEIPLLKNDDIISEENIVIEQAVNKTEQKQELKEPQENIENMLKRLYDLRQNENHARKNALLSEIYDLKKQVDETLKASDYNYSLDYNEVDTKALADYYLFNEDLEFPKLK